MNRCICLICAVIWTAGITSLVHAADLLWQQPPVTPTTNLGDANYFNNTTATANVAPTTSDILFVGATGNVTASVSQDLQKLRIGHVTGAAAYQGVSTLTVNNGAVIKLTVIGSAAD